MSSTDFSIAIGANISDFQAGMVGVRNSVSNTVNNINAQFNQFNATLSKTKASGIEFTSYLSTVVQGTFKGLGLAAKFFAEPLRQFSRYEDAATRLAPLVGGLDAAKTLTKELRDEAANGYLSLEQLTSIAGRLATVFKSSSEIKQWTSAFHNLAAGTGMDVNELVGNFVKSKASGRFEAGFMDMFAQKGVNIFEPLVAQTGMAEAALRKLATEGKLAFSEIESAILSLSTGTGKFAGQASALSNTLSGSFGTLKEEFNAVLADFGEEFAGRFTGALQAASGFLKENRDAAASITAELAKVAIAGGAAVVSMKALNGALKLASGNAGKLMTFLKGNAGSIALTAGFIVIEKISEYLEGQAADLENLNSKQQKASQLMFAVEDASSFEALEEKVNSARIALEAYYAERRNIQGKEVSSEEWYADMNALYSIADRTQERLREQERLAALAEEAKDAEAYAAEQEAAQKAFEAEEKKRMEAVKTYDERAEMIRAEIEGNAQKIAQLREQADLAKKIAEFKKAGMSENEATYVSLELQALEKEKSIAEFLRSEKGISSTETLKDKMIGMGINPELAGEYAALKAKASQGGADGNGWGVSFVGTAQAHLGGGGGFSVGENLATSLARESVQVQTRMEKLLEKIAEKHVPSGTAVFN